MSLKLFQIHFLAEFMCGGENCKNVVVTLQDSTDLFRLMWTLAESKKSTLA